MKPRVLVFTETALALTETFIAAHCRALRRYDFTLLALSRSGDHHPDVERTVLWNNPPGRRARIAYRLGFCPPLERLLAEIKPDLIHAHYLTNGAFIRPFAVRLGVPLLVTAHGHDVAVRASLRSPYALSFALARRALVRSPARILPVSDYLRGRVLALGFDPARVRTHALGIPLPAKGIANVASAPPRIVYAGRLVAQKGIDAMLEAFALVLRSRPDAQLHVVGDGPLRPLVEAHAARNRGITYHGPKSPAETQGIIATARLFTLPSRELPTGHSEGLGLVLLEAQAHGIPVVTSDRTGTAETLRHGVTGFAIDPHDVSRLAQAYLTLLDDPALAARMGAAAARHVQDRFDIRHCSANLERIYDGVLDAHRARVTP